jgi:maltose alpha-D-glucosyltransferase/alpha-amylase
MATHSKEHSLWFKDAVFYELSVRSFFDSNGDGVGDFRGLIQKLDYLEDLGITTLWLLPFYPSPLKDDGFDITDHCSIHPDCGTLDDFKALLKEAHRRGIRVIIELIMNHTSDQHPWFEKARRAKPGSRMRDYYVWSDTAEKYKEARIVLPSDESSNWEWDPIAKSFYWHRFFSHQPDLNYESPDVQMEVTKTVDFWLKLGVDGFRLASVPFLFEKEGTSCENLPETHQFLKKLRAYIDKKYHDRVLVADANQWPEEAASYFGRGAECHMNFNYPLMPRLFLALRTEDSYPIVDIVGQTPAATADTQWALFLRNHDEIALEMVTEEEKDYLFKAYANDPLTKHNLGIRRRLAPLLNNDRRKIELLYSILFSLPGTPVLYYGDEIGMGDNVFLGDRYGIRTPMQWSMEANAGFSTANPQKLHLPVISDPVYRYEVVNVAMQEESLTSMVWWMKNVLSMRKRLGVFGKGEVTFIESSNAKVLSFVRSFEQQRIIIVANLSQFSQATTLNLSEFKNCDITEAFSQNKFMNVGNGEYPITIGPYGYFWFQVEDQDRKVESLGGNELLLFKTSLPWEKVFTRYDEIREFERRIFPSFMKKCRWFGGKAKVISKMSLEKVITLKVNKTTHFLVLVEVHYVQRLPELYFMPLSFFPTETIMDRVEYTKQSVACRAEIQGKTGFILDSSYDKEFRDFLFVKMGRNFRLKDSDGVLEFNSGIFSRIKVDRVESKILKIDSTNTAFTFNDQYFFKFYRKIEREINPDLEITRFLTEGSSFSNSPRFAGSVEYRDEKGRIIVLGMLQEKVENQGDSWNMTIDSVGRFYERVLEKAKKEKLPPLVNKPSLTFEDSPELIQEFIGRGFYERVVRLGHRTAEMHQALASNPNDPEFAPEYFTSNYQRSLYSSLRKLLKDRFKLLRQSLGKLDDETRTVAERVLLMEEGILECFSEIYSVPIRAIKTRIHGDYHLGQVLFTGKDYIIIDFEGEPGFSFSERRLKKSPYKDVAGMMRSFHYAAFGKILLNENYRPQDMEILEAWAEQWQHYISRYYLGAYMDRMGLGTELPKEDDILIRTYLIEKAVYELGYELNGRPSWTIIPLRGIEYQMKRYIKEKESRKSPSSSTY